MVCGFPDCVMSCYLNDEPQLCDYGTWNARLGPGAYTLRVDVINSEGLELQAPLERDFVVTPNLALTTAVANHSWSIYHGPSDILDGDAETYWWSDDMATAGSAELTITLAEERSINRLRIVTAEEYLQSFDLEVSTDGQNYEIVGSYTTNANDSAFIEFDPVNALYVRLGQNYR